MHALIIASYTLGTYVRILVHTYVYWYIRTYTGIYVCYAQCMDCEIHELLHKVINKLVMDFFSIHGLSAQYTLHKVYGLSRQSFVLL